MKRNPGQWLRELIYDRSVESALYFGMGSGFIIVGTIGIVANTNPWHILIIGIGFLAAGLYKLTRGWRLPDMRKGARAEQTIGQAIEYALTRDTCAVAHHVEDIAVIGDIDHLVATPRGLWVIESKHGRVPKSVFSETLRRIGRNVEGVRKWAPGVSVTGCLVFSRQQNPPTKPSYDAGAETIRCFDTPTSLMRELKKETRREGGNRELAQKVWRLGKVEGEIAQWSAAQRRGGS